MVLVYSNSKERAMHLAVLLEGVVLSPTVKVMPHSYYELHDQLEAMMERDGYVCSLLRGEYYYFVYSDGPIRAPLKMVDYDPAYRDLRARPIPFFPSPFETQVVDEGFERRRAICELLAEQADSFVNAATDDQAGELAFLYFTETIGVEKPSYRARPKALTRQSVIETFNALGDENNRQDILVASQFANRLEWLFPCNATNALSTHNYERRLMPVGLIESSILVLLSGRSEAGSEQTYQVELDLERSNGEAVPFGVKAPVVWTRLSERDAADIANALKKVPQVLVAASECVCTESPLELPNAFTIQAIAGEFLSMTGRQVNHYLMELYEHGLITYPSQSHSIPWSMKPQISNALAAMISRPSYAGMMRPHQLDAFQGWSQLEDDFNRCAIVITEQDPDTARVSEEAMGVYHVLLNELISMMQMKEVATRRSLTLDIPAWRGQTVRLFESETERVELEKTVARHPPFPAVGEVLTIKDVRVVPSPAEEPETEWHLIRTMDNILDNTLCGSSRFLSDAIETLISWGYIKRDDKTSALSITGAGRLVLKYLRHTTLWEVSETVAWYKRLRQLAMGTGNPASFKSGMKDYIEDICTELIEAGDEITEMGGVDWEDLQCPICHAPIAADDENGGWVCVNFPKCRFKISPTIHGHTMTAADVAALLTRGRTDRIDDFVSSKGTYPARLTLERGYVRLLFDYPTPCPYCGGVLNEYSWGLRCKNGQCGFSLNTTVCGHTMTDAELQTVLTGGTTQNLKLTNQKGKSFSAALRLGEDKTLKFEFPPKRGGNPQN